MPEGGTLRVKISLDKLTRVKISYEIETLKPLPIRRPSANEWRLIDAVVNEIAALTDKKRRRSNHEARRENIQRPRPALLKLSMTIECLVLRTR